MMIDKSVSIWKKALIVLGIVYLVSPIDALPFFTFPLSLLDDLGVWLVIIYALGDTLDRYWYKDNVVDFSKKFNDKDVVEGVEFMVEDEPLEDHQEDKGDNE